MRLPSSEVLGVSGRAVMPLYDAPHVAARRRPVWPGSSAWPWERQAPQRSTPDFKLLEGKTIWKASGRPGPIHRGLDRPFFVSCVGKSGILRRATCSLILTGDNDCVGYRLRPALQQKTYGKPLICVARQT